MGEPFGEKEWIKVFVKKKSGQHKYLKKWTYTQNLQYKYRPSFLI